MSEQTPKPTRAQKREERRAAKEAVQAQELARVREGEIQAAEAHKKALGRPSEYTPEQADSICTWVAEGRSLRSWCRLHERSMHTVYKWLRETPDFMQRYARAHDDRADSLADEIVEIADEAQWGTLEQIQAARLRMDARKWVAAKLRPQKWGDYQPAEQRSHVTFNIGITRSPHTVGHTIDANPLITLEGTPDK